jgi:hypothetical protein
MTTSSPERGPALSIHNFTARIITWIRSAVSSSRETVLFRFVVFLGSAFSTQPQNWMRIEVDMALQSREDTSSEFFDEVVSRVGRVRAGVPEVNIYNILIVLSWSTLGEMDKKLNVLSFFDGLLELITRVLSDNNCWNIDIFV